MDRIIQDLRFAVRSLWKNPGFTLVAIAALAIGIGANTAIFTVMESALLRTMPIDDPGRVMSVSMTKQNVFGDMEASFPNFLDWKSQAHSFSGLTGYGRGSDLVTTQSVSSERVEGAGVTGDFFRILGFTPEAGRLFYDNEEKSGAKSVVLTHGMWQRVLHGDPAIVGKQIQLGGDAYTVVGILKPDFQFAPVGASEYFKLTPLEGGLFIRRNLHWFNVIGRLKPGVSQEQALAEMTTISARLAQQYPDTNAGTGIKIIPLTQRVVGDVKPVLFALMGAVGLVLLIACVNVANLLLTRALARQREMAIRNALGAGKWRIIQQLLTESILLALVGGLAGLIFGKWALDVLVAAIPEQVLRQMPYIRSASLGPAPLAFTAGISILSGVLFGLAPAWRSSAFAPASSLKESGEWGSSKRTVGFVLVGVEVALSVMLLVGAGLMIKSLVRMFDANPGFQTNNLLTLRVSLPPKKYEKDEPNIQVEQAIQRELRRLPGVVDVGATDHIALSGDGNTSRIQAEDQPLLPAGDQAEGNSRGVSGNYFHVLGARLLKGRYFDDSIDTLNAPQVVIINRSMAQLVYRTTDVVGKRVRFTYDEKEKYREIVGVVDDIKESSLDGKDTPAIYLPYSQNTSYGIGYVVRTQGDPHALMSAVRNVVQQVEPAAAVYRIQSMDDMVDRSYPTFLRRYPAMLISSFGGVALLLALIGLYGIISYSVSQRTREIGIRMALGAQRSDVLHMFMREGVKVTAFGLVVGVPAALLAGQLISGLLYGIKATDPQVIFLAPICLALMSLIAVAVPAYRATRVDPNVALRYE